MNDLIEYKPQFSAMEKRNLDHNLANIHQIGSLAKTAMEVQADVYNFGFGNLVDVASLAKLHLQSYILLYGDENLDNVFKEWFDDMKNQTQRQYEVMGNRLINVINSAPLDPYPPSFWDELFNRLYILVFGSSQPAESSIDSLRRIGNETKKAIRDTARVQLDRLPSYIRSSKVGKEID